MLKGKAVRDKWGMGGGACVASTDQVCERVCVCVCVCENVSACVCHWNMSLEHVSAVLLKKDPEVKVSSLVQKSLLLSLSLSLTFSLALSLSLCLSVYFFALT